jgi:hypothetical protein
MFLLSWIIEDSVAKQKQMKLLIEKKTYPHCFDVFRLFYMDPVKKNTSMYFSNEYMVQSPFKNVFYDMFLYIIYIQGHFKTNGEDIS